MMEKDAFLKKYRMDESEFERAGIGWSELAGIEADYRQREGTLREIGKEFVDHYLYDIERAGIHSYRYRTKDPGRLSAKSGNSRRSFPAWMCPITGNM